MNEKKITIPEFIKNIMNEIEKAGYEIYLVGGFVRDAILNIENKDYDLTTNMPLDDIRKIYNNFVIMKENDHRNTGILKVDDNEIEISSFRGDTLKEDLEERDFTINALAANKDGEIIDLVNGISDIENKKINLIKEDGYGFIFDPLRMLRAVRFSATLNFDITEDTNYEIERKINLLEDVARERIYSEIQKIMLSDNVRKVLENYPDVFEYLIPEFDMIKHVTQNHPAHNNETVFFHTMKVIDNTKANIYERLCALFHDMGKIKNKEIREDGYEHFPLHEKVSVEIFLKFAKYIKMDYDTRDKVAMLIDNHSYGIAKDRKVLKNFLAQFDLSILDEYFDIRRADIKGLTEEKQYLIGEIDEIEKECKDIIDSGECLSIKDLKVDGSDLMFLSYKGKEIGSMLNELLYNVINDELLNDREMLLEYAREKRGEQNEN